MISFFIPIRKGSKRIMNKNLRPLPGFKFGLTEIKIKQIEKFRKIIKKNLKINFEFVVSTNCEKTKKFLKQYNWIKTYTRSQKDSGDDTLDRLIKIVPNICSGDYILWTHVTSPFFNHLDYMNFIKTFLKNKNHKSAFLSDLMEKFIYSKQKGWLSHNVNLKKWPRTQDLEPLYIANSCAFIAHKNIYKYKNNRLCNNPMPIISRPNSSLDIDNYDDLVYLKNKLKSQINLK